MFLPKMGRTGPYLETEDRRKDILGGFGGFLGFFGERGDESRLSLFLGV